MTAPIVDIHQGIHVVRDDLLPGGTKTRFISALFQNCDEIVYATPAEGGAQTALAYAAKQAGKKATLFVAKRQRPHDRTILAKALGAKVYQVDPGYMTVCQARARRYCADTGATLAPFGMNTPEAIDIISSAARMIGFDPDEIWCAAGSGVLSRSLAKAFPNARRHAVQIGRKLSPADVAGAEIHISPLAFKDPISAKPPFPSDPHYDAKAWDICRKMRGQGSVLFWNVTGPASEG
jgi:hypothetical protein